MKIHNLTKGVFLIGLLEIVFSIIWFSKYYDLSQAILYIGFGCFILIFASLIEIVKRIQDNLNDKRNEILDLQLIVTEHERKLEQ